MRRARFIILACVLAGCDPARDLRQSSAKLTIDGPDEAPRPRWMRARGGDSISIRQARKRVLAPLGGLSRRQEGRILAISASADGKLVASIAETCPMVRVWDVASGSEVATFPFEARAVALRGRLVAAATEKGDVVLLDVDRPGARPRALGSHAGAVHAMAWSPRGDRLLTCGDSGGIVAWKLDGALPARLDGGDAALTGVAFLDAARIVTSDIDGWVRVREVEGGKELAAVRWRGGVVALDASPDGRRIAAASGDRVLVAEVAALAKPRALARLEGGAREVAFSRDGRRLAAAGSSGLPRVIDVASGDTLASLAGHEGRIESLAFAGDVLLTGGEDRTMRAWAPVRSEGRAPTDVVSASGASVQGIAAIDASRVAVVRADGSLASWDLGRRDVEWDVAAHEGGARAVACEGSRIVTVGADRRVRVWSLGGKPLAELRGHGEIVCAVSLSPDGRHAVTTDEGGIAIYWDLESGAELVRFSAGRAPARAVVREQPLGDRIVACGGDGPAADPAHTVGVDRFPAPDVVAIALSRDGRRLFLGGQRSLTARDLASGETIPLVGIAPDPIASVAISSDGKTGASGCDTGDVALWDLASGARFAGFRARTRAITALAFAGDRLVIGARDGSLSLAKVSPPRAVTSGIEGHEGAVAAIAYAGGRAVSGGADGRLIVWDVARRRALRVLRAGQGEIRAIALSGSLALVAGSEQTKLWDVEHGDERPFPALGAATAAGLSPDGRIALVGRDDGVVAVSTDRPETGPWDVWRSSGFAKVGGTLAFSRDGRAALVGDMTAMMWDSRTGDLHAVLGTWRSGRVAAFAPRPGWCAFADANGGWLYDPRGTVYDLDSPKGEGGALDARWTDDGLFLAAEDLTVTRTTLPDEATITWQLDLGGKPAASAMAIAPDGRSVVVGTSTGEVYAAELDVGRAAR